MNELQALNDRPDPYPSHNKYECGIRQQTLKEFLAQEIERLQNGPGFCTEFKTPQGWNALVNYVQLANGNLAAHCVVTDTHGRIRATGFYEID